MVFCVWSADLLAAAGIPDPWIPLWVMELLAVGFLYAWLFWLGATVGSFLNVVIYRLPQGLNLAYPGSRCPECGHPIRLQDNVPVLSWLVLRGRCRDCRGRISPRYFLVELTTATLFLLVAIAERHLLQGGSGAFSRGMPFGYELAPFWARYGLHVSLLATLLAAALIRSDGFLVPARLYGPVLVAGFVLTLIWPSIPLLPAAPSWSFSGWQAGLAAAVAGLIVGGLIGLIVGLGWLFIAGAWPRIAPVSLAAAISVVCGWQWGLLLSPAAMGICLTIARLLRRLSGPPVTPVEPPPLPPSPSPLDGSDTQSHEAEKIDAPE
jgi:leader peptidase (prepilin peptidase)/N-methyltransferase